MPLSTPRVTKWVLLALALAALFVFRTELLLRHEAAQTIATSAGNTIAVEGLVVDDPDRRYSSVRVAVATASGTLLAVLPPDTVVHYGDKVVVRGRVELPKNFETQNGREFDYANYLRVRGIVVTMPFAQLHERHEGGFSIAGVLFSIKHRFERSLESVLPQPQVALLEGLLLGERGGLSSALLQVFALVGLIHVVVLSGSNISIVGEGILRGLGFLSPSAVAQRSRRIMRYVLGAIIILLFVLMTGSGAAAVRALIMGTIGLVARYLRRPQLALRSLGVAMASMLLWNPLYLLDSGFVLSVLATFGLITLSPWVENHLYRVPAWQHFNLRSIAASTVAVELFLLPALLYYVGTFSLISLPVNIVVLPFVPPIMLAGFLAGLLGFVHTLLALPCALVADILLRTMIWIAQAGANVPYASATIAVFPLWVVLLTYVPILYFAKRSYVASGVATATARQSAFRPHSNSDF